MNFFGDSYIWGQLSAAAFPMLVTSVPSWLLYIASYILTALALHRLAQRRGLRHAWMSWVPLLNLWIVGSLSDQYRYVVKGQYKSKRKVLLILNLLSVILAAAAIVIAIAMAAELGGRNFMYSGSPANVMKAVFGPAMAIIGLLLPMLGVGIAATVVRYMALYDIYTSMDPANNVLFLVLSIFFRMTEPFFLFFNREKDLGMPPRKQEPVYEEHVWQTQEPWNSSENDI